MADFANVLRLLRLEKHLSQQDLADRLNISKSSISMYERGERNPDFEVLELIADFFNVDMDYLLGRTLKTTKILNPNTTADDRKSVPSDYYFNTETREIAQEIFENDKVLFDVYRSADKERLIAYAKRLKEIRDMEEGI